MKPAERASRLTHSDHAAGDLGIEPATTLAPASPANARQVGPDLRSHPY